MVRSSSRNSERVQIDSSRVLLLKPAEYQLSDTYLTAELFARVSRHNEKQNFRLRLEIPKVSAVNRTLLPRMNVISVTTMVIHRPR